MVGIVRIQIESKGGPNACSGEETEMVRRIIVKFDGGNQPLLMKRATRSEVRPEQVVTLKKCLENGG